MDQYISTTQLKQGLKEAKRLARKDVVHVLENGRAAYVLCGLDVYERLRGEARARGVWRASVEDVAHLSSDDITAGRTCDLNVILEYDGCGMRPVHVVDSAAHDIEGTLDELDTSVLVALLNEVRERPELGMTIEYDGEPKEIRKVLVPPYDVLYIHDKTSDQIVLLGMVCSLEHAQST